MLEFSAVTEENIDVLREAYGRAKESRRLCDYSAGVKRLWRSRYHPAYAFFDGCLLVKNEENGETSFEYPLPVETICNVGNALTEIERYTMEHYLPLCFRSVPQEALPVLSTRYRDLQITSDRALDEYLYRTADIIRFPGRHYAGQRNHIRRFEKACPTAKFRPVTEADLPAVRRFFDRFAYHAEKSDTQAAEELAFCRALFAESVPAGVCGCMENEGEIIALAWGEVCGDTLLVHAEKALTAYEGVYPATFRAFVEAFGEGATYVNREDDAGDSGLRRSKLQYRPALLLPQYSVDVHTELCRWQEPPVLQTPRLTLCAPGEADKEAYNRLCLDDLRNRYWGYDYRTDCPNPDESYFLSVTRADFATRTAVSFAIHKGNAFLGEVILYDFDYHGGAQIGIRILPEMGRQGYAREALAAVLDAGLYSLGLSRIRAKCYRENLPSARLLGKEMEAAGSDETFYYFERQV